MKLVCGAIIEIGVSRQEKATNTLAVDPENRPFRNDDGDLVFRPGGHGALLANLDALMADVIFLKNIDNVVPDRLKPETVRWKKVLGGVLITLQEGIFRRLRLLENGDAGEEDLTEIASFCRERLLLDLPPAFERRPPAERRSFLFRRLNRPLRVCGMVRNEGEPGGGPSGWMIGMGRRVRPFRSSRSRRSTATTPNSGRSGAPPPISTPSIWSAAFAISAGGKFPLTQFVDPALSIIARKSEQGRELLALERPGLWNGSMAFWNTVFVEVPLATFNPVKTVSDLLRPQHLPT